MPSQVDAYRAKAAEYDRKADTMGKDNRSIREYYQRLAEHWRLRALLADHNAEREQSVRTLIQASKLHRPR